MSDNNANQPPVDTRLPDELARCESILAGMSLPKSRVQRDELLYRAGWAAAERDAKSCSVRGAEQKQSSRNTGGRSTFAWSVTSAVVAASLAVAITLQVQPAATTQVNAVVDVSRDHGSAVTEEESLVTPIPDGFANRADVEWTASLLIMRDRALLQQWDDPWTVNDPSISELSSDGAMPSQPKTSREMLQEFLMGPSEQDTTDRSSTRRGLRWPWKTIHLGETT